MKDPILDKLKTDAGVVLADLWRALRRQPAAHEWQHPRGRKTVDAADLPEMPEPPKSGLCYFHLN